MERKAMNKLNHLCNKTPNRLCVDCTNDGPLCEFDECEYMNLYQNNQNNIKNVTHWMLLPEPPKGE